MCIIFSVVLPQYTYGESLKTLSMLVSLQTGEYFFMPPTSKKLRGHIGFGLSACPSVCLSVTPIVGCKTRGPLELGT